MFNFSQILQMFSDVDTATFIGLVAFIGTVSGFYFRLKYRIDSSAEKLKTAIEDVEATFKRLLQDQRYESSEKFVAKQDLQMTLKELKDEITRMNGLILQVIRERRSSDKL